jgi:hypothetical protein
MNLTPFDQALQVGLGWEEAHQYSNYVGKKNRVKKTGRTANKDSSKSKVYQAEWAWQDIYDCGGSLTFEQAVKYVDRVTKSKLWNQLNDGPKEICVEMMRDMKYAATAGRAYGTKIMLAPRHATKYVILHELAHCAGFMHHDVGFRQTVVKLVSRFMGVEAAKALKEQFKKKGLKMSIKNKILGPLEWMAAKEKMARLRKLK